MLKTTICQVQMKLYSLYHVCQGRKIGKCICVCICFKSASNYEVFFSICKGFKSWWYKNWNYTINWNDQFSFKIPERERGNKDKHESFTKINHVFSLDRYPWDHLFASVKLVTFQLFHMLRKQVIGPPSESNKSLMRIFY